MTPDVQAIVAADRASGREIDELTRRLAAHLEAERTRLEQAREAQRAAARAHVEADAAVLERDGRACVEARRAARAQSREVRRAQAASAVPAAVAAYVAIVRGTSAP